MNVLPKSNRYHSAGRPQIVYHNNGGLPDNAAYMAGLVTSLSNHLAALSGNVTIQVVCHGAGLDLFTCLEQDDKLKQRFDDLLESGVRFLVCANSLRARQLNWQALYGISEADIVPSGVAELGWLQLQGVAYIHL